MRQSRRQKPSLMSHFAKKIFASGSAVVKVWMILLSECPIWSIACHGAILSVAALTDFCSVSVLSFTGKERSRITWYGRDLCGTIAIGEILSSGGGLSFMSSHLTTRAWLALIFSLTSSCSWMIAAGSSAEMWGPLSIAACIVWQLQGCPVFVGQPWVAYSSNVSAAG